MTSEGLGEMFEGNSADTYAGKIPLVPRGGLSGGSRVRGHGSEDPHRRYWKMENILKDWPIWSIYGEIPCPLRFQSYVKDMEIPL